MSEEGVKKTTKKSLRALYFGGKMIKQKEVLVVVLKNNDQEIKLAALLLEGGKVIDEIFGGIKHCH